MTRITSRPRAVDLFCGAGGLSRGLHDAGFEIVAAADRDPDSCATHKLNFPRTTVVLGDLTDPDCHDELIEAVGDEPLDLLAGGPPCQAFSQVRNHDRLIEDPRNRLYREFVVLLDELRPRALLLENVPGLMQLRGGAIREQIEEDLSLGGDYLIQSAVLDAGDFGTPQSRTRLVFMGVRADLDLPEWPRGTGVTSALRLVRESDSQYGLKGVDERLATMLADPDDRRAVTVEQALSDLRVPGDAYTTDPASAYQKAMRRNSLAPQDHVPSRIRPDTVQRLGAIPPGGNVYDLPAKLLKRYLTDSKWGPEGNGTDLSRRHYYAYRRLHPHWLAWTANTKADFAYHYELARGLSVREAARIQGFPDRYHFITAPSGTPGQMKGGARHSRYRQVGNAVPPPLAAAVGRVIKRSLVEDLVPA